MNVVIKTYVPVSDHGNVLHIHAVHCPAMKIPARAKNLRILLFFKSPTWLTIPCKVATK